MVGILRSVAQALNLVKVVADNRAPGQTRLDEMNGPVRVLLWVAQYR
jgi:hypothetical protein